MSNIHIKHPPGSKVVENIIFPFVNLVLAYIDDVVSHALEPSDNLREKICFKLLLIENIIKYVPYSI